MKRWAALLAGLVASAVGAHPGDGADFGGGSHLLAEFWPVWLPLVLLFLCLASGRLRSD